MGANKKGFGDQIEDIETMDGDDVESSDGSSYDSDDSSEGEKSDTDVDDQEVSDVSEDDDDNDEEAVIDTESTNNIVDEEDELVKTIKAAKEKVRDHPPNIKIDQSAADICFHPEKDLLAIGTMEGDVLVYSYNNEENQLIANHELHSKPIRDVEFSPKGKLLYSVSKDRHIIITDVETGKLEAFYDKAHKDPIDCVRCLSDNTFVTGDESGIVKMWDLRNNTAAALFQVKVSDSYISDMITNSACKYLVCCGGDGALNTINLNARKIHVQTEEYESEFTCLNLMKNESKILAGSSRGKMYLFNWGEFGLHTDEYPGLKKSISCMVPVTENISVYSCEDGVLRAVHVFPHKQLGVVGQHNLCIDKIDISNNGHYLASFSYGDGIRFWNITYFEDIEVQAKKQNKRRDIRNNLPSSKLENVSDFFSGMA